MTVPIIEHLDLCYDDPNDPHPGLTAAQKMKAAAEIVGKLDEDDLGRLLAIMGVVPCKAKQERVEQLLILLGGDIHSLRSYGSELARWQARSAAMPAEKREREPVSAHRYLIQARFPGQSDRSFIVGQPLTDFDRAMQDANSLPTEWTELYVLVQDDTGRTVREIKVRG